MQNKTAIVVNGIDINGTMICRQLYLQGAKVISTYQNIYDYEIAKMWKIEQKKMGFDIDVRHVDVTQFNLCAKAIKEIEESYNSIDILINNPNITYYMTQSKMRLDEWRSALKENLGGFFNITRNVINGMIDHHYGRIVNISYVDFHDDYGRTNCIDKAGIHGFTKCLSQEIMNSSVTVNTISSGYFEYDTLINSSEGMREKIINQISIGNLRRSEEIARAVCFLASRTSGYITGSNLVINCEPLFKLNFDFINEYNSAILNTD